MGFQADISISCPWGTTEAESYIVEKHLPFADLLPEVINGGFSGIWGQISSWVYAQFSKESDSYCAL